MVNDKWGLKFIYPSKVGGFFYQQSDDATDDSNFEGEGQVSNSGGGQFTFETSGPDSFQLARNGGIFNSSAIGGCDMDFEATANRGYAYKSNDPRDIELKFIISFEEGGDNGLSIGATSGAHSGGGCCSGFTYMMNVQYNQNPAEFRFRKEMWHVSYHTDPKTGEFGHSKFNFKFMDHGNIGLCFVRYNKKDGAKGTGHNTDDSVILEMWGNPDPDDDPQNWILIKKTEDKGNWGDDGDDCGGDKDQIGSWAAAKYRIKSNDEGLKAIVKHVSLREINPLAAPDDDGVPSPNTITRQIYYNVIGENDVPPTYSKLTQTITEEMVETLTDPDPLHKYGPKGFHHPESPTNEEIGDLCDPINLQLDNGTHVMTFPDGLQCCYYWSNNDNNCVIPHIAETDLGGSTKVENPDGGIVLKNAKIYMVYWGNDWNTRVVAPTMAGLTNEIQNKLLNTDKEYFTKLSQYGSVQAPTWGGTAVNTAFAVPSATNIPVDTALKVLTDTFNRGLLTPPTSVNQNIYVVMIPLGKSLRSSTNEALNGNHGVYKTTIETPDTPPVPVDNEPSEVTGTLTLKYDIGLYRTQPCALGGVSLFYNSGLDGLGNSWILGGLTGDGILRSRVGMIFHVGSGFLDQPPLAQVDLYLQRVGSPTGLATVRVRGGAPSYTIKATIGTIDVATISTTETLYSFINLANTYITKAENSLAIEYNGGDSTNYIRVSKRESLAATGGPTKAQYYEFNDGKYYEYNNIEIPAKLWA